MKILKWIGISVAILFVVLFAAFKYLQANTKKSSPEAKAVYKNAGKEITVAYCRPFKKGREIFGGLVPYNTVWRTGANEATTFETSTDLTIGGKTLPKGKYTLWTIPTQEKWTVIFNGKQYGWGISFGQVASREAEADVLQIEVPTEKTAEPLEQFLISFDDTNDLLLVLAWDQTQVKVPLTK